MNPIDFSKLFDFSNTAELDAAVKQIEKLNTAYDMLMSSAVKRSKEYADSVNEIVKAADHLEKQLHNLDATEKEQQTVILKMADSVDKNLKRSKDYTEALKNEEATIKMLTEQQTKLVKAKQDLEKANTAETGSLTAMREEMKKLVKEFEGYGDSVSGAVKAESLTKIKDLGKGIAETEGALKTARRGVDVAAGSYNELSMRVSDAKKRLKEMEGGIGSNTEEFKKLQKFVKDGSDELKNFDKDLGDNQREVGNYGLAVDALDKRFGGLIGQVKSVGKEFLILASNPFILLIGALVGSFAALTSAVRTFFAATGEGEDVLAKQKGQWDLFFSILKKGWSDAGKEINDFFGGNVTKNLVNGILNTAQATFPLLSKYINQVRKDFNSTVGDVDSLTDAMDALADRMIANIIKVAETTRDVNDLTLKSQDKLNYSDEQRLQFLKAIAKMKGDQNEIDKQIAKEQSTAALLEIGHLHGLKDAQILLLTEKQKLALFTEAENKKIAEAYAHVIDLDGQFAQESKRNAAKIVSLTMEIEKAKRDTANRIMDSDIAFLKYEYEASVRYNQLIIKDDNASFEERKAALEQAAVDRNAILAIEKQTELNTVQRAAEDRIRAEGKVVTDNLIAQDKALQKQRETINDKYKEMANDTARELADTIRDVLVKGLEQDFKNVSNEISTSANADVQGLNAAYNGGLVSLRKYNQERKRITVESGRDIISEQITSLEKELKAFEGEENKKLEIEKTISALRLQLSQQTTDQIIADQQKLKDAAVNLGNQVLSFVTESFKNQSDQSINALNAQLANEEENKNRRLAIVSNDAQARAAIEQDFVTKQKAIQKEIVAEKRKQAVFDKAIATTQAIVQTALGVNRALGSAVPPLNFILAALVGAAGAVQVARIISQPIPQFYTGTGYSPEGPALVAEKGRELAVTPDGKLIMLNKPHIRHLAEGTKILPNAQTEALMRDAKESGLSYLFDQVGANERDARALRGHSSGMDARGIIAAVERSAAETVTAIKSTPQDVFDEYGYRRYERKENSRVQRLDKRYRLQ